MVPRSPTIEPWLYLVTEELEALAPRFGDVCERGDLESTGVLALYEAAASHEARRHEGFPHYARCFVRGRMLRAIARELRQRKLKVRLYGEAVTEFTLGELVLPVNVVTAEPNRLLDAGREGVDELMLAALIAGVSVGTGFASQDDLEDAEEYDRAIALVRRLLEALHEDQRVVVELVYAEGLTQVEAATRLGVHRNTVVHRLRHALRQMREVLVAHGILEVPQYPPDAPRATSVWPSGVGARGPPDSSRG